MPIPYKGQEPKTGLVMGEHTEITAKYYNIPRAEQDELAFKSHQNMAKAYDEGFLMI
jgi:acetyl-CoA C-acetyltransferase